MPAVSSTDGITPRRTYEGIHADIVICVHNAFYDVRRCLSSLVRHTDDRHRIILVDDGSDSSTRDYLVRFSESYPDCILLRNEEALGYTKAANQGIKISDGDYIVLLNSDTIATPQWIEKIFECGESDQSIGIIGPLSNAASWQSVPHRFSKSGDWEVNKLPEECTPLDMAALIDKASNKAFPKVPFLNGFCYAIKRKVVEDIGVLDEIHFPKGYGEENDYSLRARDAGYHLAIADHAYVFHAKSRSYSHQVRKQLASRGRKALLEKYPESVIERGVMKIRNHQELRRLRDRLNASLRDRAKRRPISRGGRFRILFLLPIAGGSGGAHSIIQEAMGMRQVGVDAQIATKLQNRPNYTNDYPNIDFFEDLFVFYASDEELIRSARGYDVVIATIFFSVELLDNIYKHHRGIQPAYYVQDYEPWFFTPGSMNWLEAYKSYTLVENSILFAKTNWLCKLLDEKHNVDVKKVLPSLDTTIYRPDFNKRFGLGNDDIRITAMLRPSTPRRAPERTLDILTKVAAAYSGRLQFHFFGCTDEELDQHGLKLPDNSVNHSILIREEVAKLLQKSDIFVDFSDYQAFGRTGLEAMACGSAVVLPVEGGVDEYAIHGENALVEDSKDISACVDAVLRLIRDDEYRYELQMEAITRASEFSIERAAISEIIVLMKEKSFT